MGRGRGEVLRPERSGPGARGLGGGGGDGQSEQISTEMKTGIGGMTGRTGGDLRNLKVWPRIKNWRSVGRQKVPVRPEMME